MPRAPWSSLFPYTTLFRSDVARPMSAAAQEPTAGKLRTQFLRWAARLRVAIPVGKTNDAVSVRHVKEFRLGARWRSEEHTSELQSHSDLVCRLLLEKKKH